VDGEPPVVAGADQSSHVIATTRLWLRPVTPADVPKLFAMSQEPGMRRWIPDQVYRDEAHAAEVAAALAVVADPRRGAFVLGIELVETRELVGHVGLSPARGSVEVGYAIEDARQGRGFASEAVRAMTEWALRELALPEVLGIVAADNLASCRVLEKAAFLRLDSGVYRRAS
jgi:ribosomal-protein-alanine N-acetyltransferase